MQGLLELLVHWLSSLAKSRRRLEDRFDTARVP